MPAHVSDAAAIIKAGVQQMAQAAAIQGVEAGVKAGVVIGVATEGFPANGTVPETPGVVAPGSATAAAQAAGLATATVAPPVAQAAGNLTASRVLKSVMDGQMENNVTIVIQPIKTLGGTAAPPAR